MRSFSADVTLCSEHIWLKKKSWERRLLLQAALIYRVAGGKNTLIKSESKVSRVALRSQLQHSEAQASTNTTGIAPQFNERQLTETHIFELF